VGAGRGGVPGRAILFAKTCPDALGYVIQYCLRNTAVYIIYINRVCNIILLILAIKHPTRAETSVPRPAAPAPPKFPPSRVTSFPCASEIPLAPHPPLRGPKLEPALYTYCRAYLCKRNFNAFIVRRRRTFSFRKELIIIFKLFSSFSEFCISLFFISLFFISSLYGLC